MKNKQVRREEALDRQKVHNALTISQKILKLNLMFGEGKGAKKERAKLALASIKESEGRIAKVKKEENHEKSINNVSKHNHKHNKNYKNGKAKNV